MKNLMNMYVSSTELASVFHASRYTSRKKLFAVKCRREIQRYDPPSVASLHGIKYEPCAINLAKQMLGPERTDWMKPGIVIDPWSPVSCSPDQICESFGIEVKCPWKRKLPEKTEDIINDNLLQAFACIHVCKLDHWFLFYYDAYEENFRCFKVSPNQDLWENRILPRVREFLSWVEVGNSRLGNQIKKKNDKVAWELLREQILQGVERVL